MFRYAFPFEGNWNHRRPFFRTLRTRSDTLSRLKGIETQTQRLEIHPTLCVQIRFPVWRELKRKDMSDAVGDCHRRSDTLSRLKGIETLAWALIAFSPYQCSDTLSRLKGIETFIGKLLLPQLNLFRYAFPFEGNWNQIFFNELKHFSLLVQIRFPVWRELKLVAGRDNNEIRIIAFRYAFPFEGNWNLGSFNSLPNAIRCSDTLSRLKGIETYIPSNAPFRF